MTIKKTIRLILTFIITSTLGMFLFLVKAFFVCYECFNQGTGFTGSTSGFITDVIMLPLSPLLALYNFPISLDLVSPTNHPFHIIPEWSFWLLVIVSQILYIILLDKYLFKKKG